MHNNININYKYSIEHQPLLHLLLRLQVLLYLITSLGLSLKVIFCELPELKGWLIIVLVIVVLVPVAEVLLYELPPLIILTALLLVLYLLLLLVPAPLIHLRLRQPCYLRHMHYLVLCPVHLSVQFLLQQLYLPCTFSLPFFNAIFFPVSFILRQALLLDVHYALWAELAVFVG